MAIGSIVTNHEVVSPKSLGPNLLILTRGMH